MTMRYNAYDFHYPLHWLRATIHSTEAEEAPDVEVDPEDEDEEYDF